MKRRLAYIVVVAGAGSGAVVMGQTTRPMPRMMVPQPVQHSVIPPSIEVLIGGMRMPPKGAALGQLLAGTTEPPEKYRGAVDAVLKQMASEDFHERTKGTAAVEGLPIGALPLVEAAAVDPKMDEEVRDRLATAVGKLEIKAIAERAAAARALRQTFMRDRWLKAYDEAGTKSAAWDDLVRKAIAADWSDQEPAENERAYRERRLAFYQAAIDKGCNDPLVLFRWASLFMRRTPAEQKLEQQRFIAAADGMMASGYPAYEKELAYRMGYMEVKEQHAPSEQNNPQEQRYAKAAFDTWQQAAATPGLTTDMLRDMAERIVEMNEPERSMWRNRSVEDLRMAHAPLSALATALGRFDLDAMILDSGKLNDERAIALMQKRAKTSREYLEKAWAADPLSTDAAAGMIEEIQLEQSLRDLHFADPADKRTREEATAEVDLWFARAMAADPGNAQACQLKLRFMSHGGKSTPAEILKFGREMFAKGPWTSKVPDTLMLAHDIVGKASGDVNAYYARPEVYAEVKNYFLELMKHDPDPVYDRSRFLKCAVLASDWNTAAAQIRMLGDVSSPQVIASPQAYDLIRRMVASKLGNPAATRPAEGAPTATQSAIRPG